MKCFKVISNLLGQSLKSLLKPSSGKAYFEIPAKGFGNQCWLAVSMSEGARLVAAYTNEILTKNHLGDQNQGTKKLVIVPIKREKTGVFIKSVCSNPKGLCNEGNCSTERMNTNLFYRKGI